MKKVVSGWKIIRKDCKLIPPCVTFGLGNSVLGDFKFQDRSFLVRVFNGWLLCDKIGAGGKRIANVEGYLNASILLFNGGSMAF